MLCVHERVTFDSRCAEEGRSSRAAHICCIARQGVKSHAVPILRSLVAKSVAAHAMQGQKCKGCAAKRDDCTSFKPLFDRMMKRHAEQSCQHCHAAKKEVHGRLPPKASKGWPGGAAFPLCWAHKAPEADSRTASARLGD